MFDCSAGSLPVSAKQRRLAAASSAIAHCLFVGIAVAVAFVRPDALLLITPPCADVMTTRLIFKLPSAPRPPSAPSREDRDASAPIVAVRRVSSAASDLAVPLADAEGDDDSATSSVTELSARFIGGVCGCGVIGGIAGGAMGGLTAVSLPPVDLPRLPSGPLRVGGSVPNPIKLVDVQPTYPPLARHARIEGVVVLDATIDETGRVVNVHVIRSITALDRAAIDAVRQWRYAPFVVNGRAIAVMMTVTASFVL